METREKEMDVILKETRKNQMEVASQMELMKAGLKRLAMASEAKEKCMDARLDQLFQVLQSTRKGPGMTESSSTPSTQISRSAEQIRGILSKIHWRIRTKIQSATKLKKIIQESKATVVESDVRSRMQPLKDQLMNTIDHLQGIFEMHVFVATCRGYWDRMGQDVLSFMENSKENKVWYKARESLTVRHCEFPITTSELVHSCKCGRQLEEPKL